MNTTSLTHASAQAAPSKRPLLHSNAMVAAMWFVPCAPLGIYFLWRQRARWFAIVPYALFGLPVFLVLYLYLGIIGFAALLPDLDLQVAPTAPRTIRSNFGKYESTFLKTGAETGGAYELIQVQIEPKGGNQLHYHRQFEETFTAIEGQLKVVLGDRTVVLNPGESATAERGMHHTFSNPGEGVTTMQVRVTPARGLEKSLRTVYGMDAANMFNSGTFTQRLWRWVLLLGYSETYLPGIHPLIQEPLVPALAKIAQWLGKDQELQVFFE